jgi:hypothetical protein
MLLASQACNDGAKTDKNCKRALIHKMHCVSGPVTRRVTTTVPILRHLISRRLVLPAVYVVVIVMWSCAQSIDSFNVSLCGVHINECISIVTHFRRGCCSSTLSSVNHCVFPVNVLGQACGRLCPFPPASSVYTPTHLQFSSACVRCISKHVDVAKLHPSTKIAYRILCIIDVRSIAHNRNRKKRKILEKHVSNFLAVLVITVTDM